MTPEELRNLSREELIALVLRKNKTIQQKNKTIQQKDKTIQRRDKTIQQKEKIIQRKNEAIQQKDERIKQLEKTDSILRPMIRDALLNLEIYAKQMRKHLFTVDDIITRDLIDQVQFITEGILGWAKTARAYFLETPFAKEGPDFKKHGHPDEGQVNSDSEKEAQFESDVGDNLRHEDASINNAEIKSASNADNQPGDNNKSDAAADSASGSQDGKKNSDELTIQQEKLFTTLNKVASGLKSSTKSLNRFQNLLKSDAIKDFVNGNSNISDAGKAATAIANTPVPQPKTPGGSGGKGRTGKNRSIAKTLKAKSTSEVCLLCGGKTQLMGQIVEEFFHVASDFKENFQKVKNLHDFMVCTSCGHVYIEISDKQNVPVVPNRSVTCEKCAIVAQGLYNGISMSKMIKESARSQEMGADTFYYNFRDFGSYYLEPLARMVKEQAQKAEVIIIDGTPFPCLATQGKRPDWQGEKNPKQAERSPVKTYAKSYMLGVTASDYAEKKFCYYSFCPSRSGESVAGIITPQWRFKGFSTDAYGVYPGLLQSQHPDAVWQADLVHFRRECIKACVPNEYAEELAKLNGEELMAKLKRDLEQDSPAFLLLSVITAIGGIFAHEKEFCAPGDKNREKRRALRQGVVKKLADEIDVIMQGIAKGRVTQLLTGKYQACSADPYAKPCVYYLNNRKGLRAFLEHPELPLSSNSVERAIRPLAIIRKNINWVGSEEGARNLARVFTVMGTLRANGIEAGHFLKQYCHALYKYCLEKKWTQEYEQGKDISKKILIWDMRELSEGFDFQKWNPLTWRG